MDQTAAESPALLNRNKPYFATMALSPSRTDFEGLFDLGQIWRQNRTPRTHRPIGTSRGAIFHGSCRRECMNDLFPYSSG